MKLEGLSIALGEIRCFCINQSGIIRESLSRFRNNLNEREQRYQNSNNQYQSLFLWPPWLLLTAIGGPLIFCSPDKTLLDQLKYIKQRLNSIKLLVLTPILRPMPIEPVVNVIGIRILAQMITCERCHSDLNSCQNRTKTQSIKDLVHSSRNIPKCTNFVFWHLQFCFLLTEV